MGAVISSKGMVRRVLVKGSCGAGKSTLGTRLAGALGVPYVELDALHHGPNWSAASPAELQARTAEMLDDERGWVVDGNYDSKLGPMVLDRAELVIWLDLPLQTKLLRLTRRTARRWFRQEVLWNGNRETVRGAFWGGGALFPWAIRTHFLHRREWPQRLADRTMVRLRTTREVAAWFSKFASGCRGGSADEPLNE